LTERLEPAVSVVVPARDAASTLPRTLAGLKRQQLDAPFEVIVVDNGSTDGTAEIAEQHPLKPRVIRRRRGEGAGAARNEGVAASRGEALAFIDSDCDPTPTWLAEGLRTLLSVDLVAGAVRPAPDERVGLFDRTLWVTREHGLYETANLFVRREWFERLGGFQDWVSERPGSSAAAGRPFGEDVWFAWRARRLGARTAFEPRSVVHHAVFPGTARDYVAEQWRLRHFPSLMKRIPELRDAFAWHRWFLNARTAAFDAATAGAVTATLLQSVLPLGAAVPYAVLLLRDVRRWGARRALVITSRDAVSCVALVVGSLHERTPLL
jgi:glycosyltransferase involved in cell wall biosynthesis